MEAGLNDWLTQHYRNAAEQEPLCKRVRFSDMLEEARAQHSPMVTNFGLAQAISDIFPSSTRKRVGERRQTFVYGIEKIDQRTMDVQTRTQYLEEQVQQLQQRVVQLEREKEAAVNNAKLESEMQALVNPRLDTHHGPDTTAHLESFSLASVMEEFEKYAPKVFSMLQHLGDCGRFEGSVNMSSGGPSSCASSSASDDDDNLHTARLRITTSLCTLVKCRSAKVLGLQLFLSIMLVARATHKQVITVLNHAGVCISYSTTWKYLRRLTAESRFLEIVREGHWIWAYDNLNVYIRVRHERQDHHNTMTNLTSRLAINIRYLPDFPFSWSDCTPQRPRSSLTIDDFLPSEADAAILKERATHYMMVFLVSTFSSLKDLAKLIPPVNSPHPVAKSNVVPMKVLFKDEKYKSVTIEILEQLLIDAGLSGDEAQLIVGDQLTCKNVRGCKLWRATELQAKNRLTWAHENPGDFHFLWECLKVIFLTFWGTPAHPGSLSNLKEIFRRHQVDKAVKVFNVGDEFLVHSFKAHLSARVCHLLQLTSVTDIIQHENSLQWLRSTAERLVADTLLPLSSTDASFARHRAFLHTSFLYIDTRNAIRYEDGAHIVRMWKVWLPRFIGSGRKNYATESVHHLASIVADLPKHLAFIAVHNRTVNMQGKVGHGKPIDQMVEHYNLALKEAMRSGGANNTPKHIEDISLSGLFLMEVARRVDKEFATHRPSSAHTARDSSRDIIQVAHYLMENQVTVERAESVHGVRATEEVRQEGVALEEVTDVGNDSAAGTSGTETQVQAIRGTRPQFIDPVEVGLDKLFNSAWLRDTLERVETAADDLQERDNDHTNDPLYDPNYELHHVC